LQIPTEAKGDSLRISLRPAASNPDRPVSWRVAMQARFDLASPIPVDRGGSGLVDVSPGATVSARFAIPRWPVALPATQLPVITVVALQGESGFWTREVTLRHERKVLQ
ncbi:MAG TPA: hypothetical protein PLL69_12930, partial [Gemmatimonadales bacterium]|nr:hypothetical protein [Gemmatimonadales bacterium]